MREEGGREECNEAGAAGTRSAERQGGRRWGAAAAERSGGLNEAASVGRAGRAAATEQVAHASLSLLPSAVNPMRQWEGGDELWRQAADGERGNEGGLVGVNLAHSPTAAAMAAVR